MATSQPHKYSFKHRVSQVDFSFTIEKVVKTKKNRIQSKMEIYEPDYTNIGNTAKLRMTAKIFNKWLIKDMSKRANWYKEDTTRDMLAISDG